MSASKAATKRTSRYGTIHRRAGRRRLCLEFLEDRRLLSADGLTAPRLDLTLDWRLGARADEQAADYDAPDGPRFAPGEIVIGFDGHWKALHRGRGSEAALEIKAELFSSLGLSDPSMLVPFQESRPGNPPVETRWNLAADTDVKQLVQSLTGLSGITYAEPNYVVSVDFIPNDSRFDSLWGLHNTGQNGGTPGADISALAAWEVTVGSSATVVGVIDTGIDYTHPDLLYNIWIHQDEIPPDLRAQLQDVEGDGRITFRDLNSPLNAAFVRDINGNGVIDPFDLLNDSRWVTGTDTAGNGYVDDLFGWNFVSNTNDPFDDHGHGTHVAGTIGASGNNSEGVAGVNWTVQLMGLKFLGAGGSGTTANAVAALNYATMMANRGENVRLTNNSWGGGAFSQALDNAIAASGDADMLFIASAGNSARNTDASPHYPASYNRPNVISVAATDRNDRLASFSNYGANSVHLAAPGVAIVSTYNNATYRSLSGTSMAAPHVSGVAALAWSVAPDASYQEIRDAMLAGVDPIAALEGITVTGGRLNARNTLSAFPSDVGDTLATARPTRLVSPAVGDSYIVSQAEIGDGPFGDRDVDVYQLRGIPGSSFTAVTRQAPGADPMNAVLRLFDAQGTELARDDGDGFSQITFAFATAAPYFIAVSGAGNADYDPQVGGSGRPGQTGSYQLEMSYDIGDTLATAAPTGIVELGEPFRQRNTRIGDGPFGDRDVDIYVFHALAQTRLSAVTSRPAGEEATSTVLRLFDADGNELLIDNPPSDYASLEFTFPESGTYYLGVSGAGNDQYDPRVGGSGTAGLTGHYRLDLSVDVHLEFSRYFGGTGHEDFIMATTVADHGGVFVAGGTDSLDLPEARNEHHGGPFDAFVANVGPDGAVLWSTYVGGSGGWEWAEGIAVDSDNNVYVVGITTSNDLPKSTNSSPGAAQNAFVAKVDSSGELVWTTYVGGSAFDSANGIALDSNNNVFIAGSTRSEDLLGRVNEYQGGLRDHFVAKLASDGSLQWSMYVGGSHNESEWVDLAVDSADNIVLLGTTRSQDLPGATNDYPGGTDSGYLAKIVLDEEGQPSLAWTAYWGGSGTDTLTALAIGQDDNILFTGHTRSTDLPEATNGYLSYSGNTTQAFVAKLDGEDGAPTWTTYLGGASGHSWSTAVAVDDEQNVFVLGYANLSDYRLATNRNPSGWSGTLVKVDGETGESTWMMYLGGSSWDEAVALAIGPDGQVYVGGYTNSPDFIGTSNPFGDAFYNGFLLKLDPQSVPAPPVSPYNDAYSVVSGGLLVIDAVRGVLANDVLPPGTDEQSLSVELRGSPLRGQVQLAGDGSFVYTPPPNFIGNDVFRYRVFDGVRYSRTTEVTIAVQATAVYHSTDTPIEIRDRTGQPRRTDSVLNISGAGESVGALVLDLSITHPTRSQLSADLVGPSGKRVELFNRVNIFPTTYNLSSHFYGEPLDGTWRLEIWDHVRGGIGTLNSWSLSVVPLTQNSPPVAGDDSYSVAWNETLTVPAPGVLANDMDPDGDPLTAVLVAGPGNGTLLLEPNGSFSYTPGQDFHGTDSFTYRAHDGLQFSNVATVTITVAAPNRPPVAADDDFTVSWNRTLDVAAPGVLANDTDPDGDPLTAELVGGPTYGQVTLNADGSFNYSPDVAFVGTDSFTYRAFDGEFYSDPATVTIDVINRAPVAVDDSYWTPFQTPLVVSAPGVLANDSDPDGDPLTAVLVKGPSSGTLTFNANGSFSYAPDQDFHGTDSFTYVAGDGLEVSNIATVTITVAAPNRPPVAQPDSYQSTWNRTLLVSAANGVLANDTDPDGDPLTAQLASGPTYGQVTLNADGSFSYTPDVAFVGTDSFTYRAFDGEHYSDPATVTIDVINQAPVAVGDSYWTPFGTSLVVPAPGVLANDSDPDGDPLTAVLVNGPSSGTLTLNADGSFVFTPASGFQGDVTFTYQASDGNKESIPATVTITVQPDVTQESFHSEDTPLPIVTATPSSVGVTDSLINIDRSITIDTLVVDVSLSYSRNNDLSGHLIGPDGTRVDLFHRVESIPTSFDVSSHFQDKELDGTWRLELVDHHHRNSSGTLHGWSLTVTGVAGNLAQLSGGTMHGSNDERSGSGDMAGQTANLVALDAASALPTAPVPAFPQIFARDVAEHLGFDAMTTQNTRNFTDDSSAPPTVPVWSAGEKPALAAVDQLMAAANSQDASRCSHLDAIEDILDELLIPRNKGRSPSIHCR